MGSYGYVFVAQEDEQNDSESLQRQKVQEYVSGLDGGNIEHWVVEENVSFKKPFRERPAGSKLLAKLKPGDSIVAAESKYLLSSAVEGGRLLRYLKKNHIALYCVDLGVNISLKEKRKLVVSEGSAELVEKLLVALAACECSKHGEAIKAAKRSRKKQGKYLGGPVPFGWEVNSQGVLVRHEEQQRIIDHIEAMRADRWSYRDISKKLREERGIRLSHEGVRRIVSSNRRAKSEIN